MVVQLACQFCTAWHGACGVVDQGPSVSLGVIAMVGSQLFQIARNACLDANAAAWQWHR